jgi:hypothetical protein
MNEKIENFIKFYKGVSTYGPARAQSEFYRDSYTIPFDENDFANQVYVPVQMEQDLWKEVNELFLGKIITLCGPAGSGKSSVSIIVKRKLEENKKNLVIFVDMRLENAAKYYDDKENTINESAIRELILSKFRNIFYVEIENTAGPSLWEELLYFILSPEKTYRALHESQIFNVFSADVMKVGFLYRGQVPERNVPFRKWFFENLNSKELNELQLSVFEKLDVSHYVSFTRHKKLYNKIIIWLDNIDSFSNNQQLLISSFLQNLQRSILNSCNIVISVREENIYRIGEFKDYLNEPFPSRVTFEDPGENALVEEYDALNFSVIKREKLEEITRRKIDFGALKYKECVDREKSGEKLNAEASGIIFSDDYRLTDEEFDAILNFSARANKCFDSEKVIYLSNNSIRDYLRIHAGFLRTVFSEKESRYTKLIAEETQDWKVTTEFLSWLHKINEPFRLDTFNVFKEIGKFKTENGNNDIACFLPYLVLTTIWNECLKLKNNYSPENNPYLSNIIELITESFQFKRSDVLHAVFSLYGGNTGRNHFITFRQKKKLDKAEELETLDTTVRITLRGKAVIGSVITSFGYLRTCIDEADIRETRVDVETILVQKIKAISRIHLESLQNIRNNTPETNNNWLDDYLVKYGLPMDPLFVRTYYVGFDIGKIEYKRSLYLQTLCVSLSNYFYYRKKITQKTDIDSVSTKFSEFLGKLREGEEFETFDFE